MIEKLLNILRSQESRNLYFDLESAAGMSYKEIIDTLINSGFKPIQYGESEIFYGGDGSNSTLNNERILIGVYNYICLFKDNEVIEIKKIPDDLYNELASKT